IPQSRAGDGHLHQPERSAVTVGQYRFGTALGDNTLPAIRDLRNRFIPADALPFPRTLGSDPAQGAHEAIAMVTVIEVGADLGAQPAARERIGGVAAEVHRATVLHGRDNTASVGTIVRAGTADLQRSHSSDPRHLIESAPILGALSIKITSSQT